MGRASRRGLTIIEIALATAILAIMASLTWGSISRSFDAYETVTGIDARYHNIRVAMNRMAKELSMAYLTSPTRTRSKEVMWKTLFKAKAASPFYEVNFTSFAHQVLREDAKESDQCEIGYFGEADPDNRSQMNLMRREDPRPDREIDKGGRSEVLAEDVKDFKLRFFDPRRDDWTDDWDSEGQETANRLPTIIEILLTIEGEDGKDITFTTKTRVYLPNEIQRF